MAALEHLHPSPDYVSDVIRDTGDFYERVVLDEIARRLAGVKPGVLVDVGAMIGNHTVYLAEHVPHRAIHAFEPIPTNLAVLIDNVTPYAFVVVHPVALSDHPRRVRMEVEPQNWGHGLIGETGSLEVNAIMLDSLRLQDVRLIKIDVEGHEPQVLAGARETIARCRPILVVEDWTGALRIPGYRIAAEWEAAHQTFLFEPY